MDIRKNDILLEDTINSVENSSQLYHIYLKTFKSVTGLRNHLRSYEMLLVKN